MLSLKFVAMELGGEAHGDYVLAPGPGHSRRDRSLRVKLDPKAENGFLVHSFAGDDWKACREYVRGRLGLEKPNHAKVTIVPPSRPVFRDEERYAKARELWFEARTDDLRRHLRSVYPKLFRDDVAWNEAFRMASERDARNE